MENVNKCRHIIVYNVDPSQQALLDIQEFYELTLMDDGKTNEAKASVALEMASRYESLSFDIICVLVIIFKCFRRSKPLKIIMKNTGP